MLSLKDFKKNAIAINGLKSIAGGSGPVSEIGDDDTPGGLEAFGEPGPSICDIDNGDGTEDHLYESGRWITFVID